MKYKLFNTKVKYLIATIVLISGLASCEDPVPTDYKPENYIEAYMLVDQPIRNVVVLQTQPVTDSFKIEKALIRDADVRIITGNTTYQLIIDPSGKQGYYYPDTTVHVLPNTKYELKVTFKDGTSLSGETTTPGTSKWLRWSCDTLQYPKDTLNVPVDDSLYIQWQPVKDISFYMIGIQCLDSLEYGKYLLPKTEEKNRRIHRPWNQDEMFKNLTNWAFIPNTKSPVVFGSFKWFGLHKISIYAPDYNMLRWFIQNVAKNTYDPLLNSIKGNGFGVFGSASVINNYTFIRKNQP